MSFCNSSAGEGKQEGEVGQAEETKELLLRAFCVPVKAPTAFHSLPHQHSERQLHRNLRLREVYWVIQNHQLDSGGAWIQTQVRLTPELVFHSSHPLWFFRLLSSLQPGYV